MAKAMLMTTIMAIMYVSGILLSNFVAYFPAKKLEHQNVSR
jgi:hypothetical protein